MDDGSAEGTEAELRLMAAAPELAEALAECLALLDMAEVASAAKGRGLVPVRQRARAAREKAGVDHA